MQDELNQFERNQIWPLRPRLDGHPMIGTMWVFRNTLDEFRVMCETKLDWLQKGTTKRKT